MNNSLEVLHSFVLHHALEYANRNQNPKQTRLERVRQARICVAIWAIAYEFFNHSWVSDSKYDETSKQVEAELHIDTDKPKLDKWYRSNFQAHTGQWVHKHPDLKYLKQRVKYMIELKEKHG